jgi:hypothetical protein
MREIPEELVARIESGAATMCHVWILTRAGDEERIGFTDHDRDLVVDTVTCRAASGWSAGANEAGVGAAGGIAIGGALDEDGFVEADVLAGVWDRARCECRRVDWRLPDLGVILWRGTLSKIRREGEAFVADLEGALAALDQVVGRTFGRGCDAVFGDGRCRVDRAAFPGLDCDKAWATCSGVFGNCVNFQGFPDIPGDDFLTAYPAEGGRHDGGSRR